MNNIKKIFYWLVVGCLINTAAMFIIGISWIDATGVTSLGMLLGHLATREPSE